MGEWLDEKKRAWKIVLQQLSSGLGSAFVLAYLNDSQRSLPGCPKSLPSYGSSLLPHRTGDTSYSCGHPSPPTIQPAICLFTSPHSQCPILWKVFVCSFWEAGAWGMPQAPHRSTKSCTSWTDLIFFQEIWMTRSATLFLFLGGFSQDVALRQRLARYSQIVPSHHRCPTHLALMFYNQLPAAWRVSVSWTKELVG